jgi:GT2 family glycosyltransferase
MNDNLTVGYVVPTLGLRNRYLIECLTSIKNAGCTNIFVVGPLLELQAIPQVASMATKLIDDPGQGLTGAINYGVSQFPKDVEYIGWLGDDDLLTPDSIRNSLKVFSSNNQAVATYGRCRYISHDGKSIFLNKSGKWASRFMNVLPNFIPQPGSLISRSAFEKIEGVKSDYPLSFDFEMFFNLKRYGKLVFIDEIQGFFRWHSESLSVDQRTEAVKQTSQIRRNNLPFLVRRISFLWEPIIQNATIFIGTKISKKMN